MTILIADWSHLEADIGDALLSWVYQDELKVPSANKDLKLPFLVKMLQAASQYKLIDLLTTCEQLLTPMVDVSNCVELFVRAEEASAETLRKFCASLMSSHWVFNPNNSFRFLNINVLSVVGGFESGEFGPPFSPIPLSPS